MRITAKHPVRAELSNLPNYFASKGDAIYAIHAVLRRHKLRTDDFGMYGDDGYVTLPLRNDCPDGVVCACCGEKLDREVYDNCIVVAHYVMISGHIELTTYVS